MSAGSALPSVTFQQVGFISPEVSAEAWARHAKGPPLRLGVLASGSGSNFEAIAQWIADGKLNAKIHVLVYNKPDAKARDRAQRWNIPSQLLNHKDFSSREALDDAIVQVMRQHDVDWVIMAGWMRIVTQRLIDAFPGHVLNIHPSLLPSFRGARAVEQALAAQVKVTGCSVHRVALEVDSGPILIQAAVPILPDDTADTLHARIQVMEHQIFPRAIVLAADGDR
jgi:phosphoribosylglycinamide formyltransferase 1